MKFIQILLFAALFSHFSTQAAASGSAIGFELFELSGTDKVSLASLKGKVVYLHFWASWCRPCKQALPEFNKLYAKYRAQGLEVVAINLDSNPKDGQKFLKEFPVDYTVLFDGQGKVAERFDVQSMPTSALIDKRGMLRLNHKGFKKRDMQGLDLAITKLLKE